MDQQPRWWHSLIVYWLVFTLIYSLSTAVLGAYVRGYRTLVLLIGMFVPVGPLSFLGIVLSNKIWAFAVLIGLLIIGTIVVRRLPKAGTYAWLYNLIALFLITLIIDLLVYQKWESLNLLLRTFKL